MTAGRKIEKPGVKIPFRLWYGLTVGFLVIPVIIFLTGYLRWYVGIPLAVCMVIFSVITVLGCTKPAGGKTALEANLTDFKIPFKYLIGFAVFAVFLAYFSGVAM